MKQIPLFFPFSFFSLILAGFSIQAETAIELPDYVVTATRTARTINHLSAASTVFTRQDIERLQVQSVPEILKLATGVDVSESGGRGKNTSVFIRGTSTGQILVLIDGVRIGSATTGTTPFSSLPIDQIERIEIVRGSQSSLYGPDAIGGVIQIFTRKGSQKEDAKPTISISSGGGSYDTAKVSGNINGKFKQAWYSLGGSHETTAGFNATSGNFDNDRDGYENTSFNVRLGYQFNDDYSAEAFIIRSQGNNEFDTNFGSDENDFVVQNIGLTAKMQFTDYWLSTLTFGESRDEFNQPDDSYFNTRRRMVSLANKIQVAANHEIVIGSDFRDDQVQSLVDYAESNRYDIGGFAEYYGLWFDLIHFNASVRGDEDEQFGSRATGNAGFRIEILDSDIDLVGSFSSGYKAPTFNDLYFPNFGNPNLKPEESTTFEVGLEGEHQWGRWMLRAYHINIDNLIGFVDLGGFNFLAVNIGKSQIDGIEGEISTQMYGWNIALNGSALSPKDRITNERLPNRSQLHLALDISRTFFNKLNIGSTLSASNDRSFNVFGGGTVKTHGSVAWDMRAAYQLNKNWAIKAKLNNMLNDQYQTNRGFNTADRNFFASVHFLY